MQGRDGAGGECDCGEMKSPQLPALSSHLADGLAGTTEKLPTKFLSNEKELVTINCADSVPQIALVAAGCDRIAFRR